MATTVVLVQGEARRPEVMTHLLTTAWRMGFDCLAHETLSARQVGQVRDRAAATGGLPWLHRRDGSAGGDRNGGAHDGAELLWLHDALPHPPSPTGRGSDAGVDNLRAWRLDERSDASLRRRLPDGSWRLSTSTTDAAATAAATTLLGAEAQHLAEVADAATVAFRDPGDVLRPLSLLGERARVDLVRHGDGLAVRKTFRPGRDRYRDREVEAMTRLRSGIPQIAELLEVDGDRLTTACYRDRLAGGSSHPDPRRRPLLPLPLAREMLDVVRAFYDHGYALIDVHPDHFLFDPEQGLKIIDFEFLHRYTTRPARFEDSYDLAGPPDDLDERDVPAPTWVLGRSPYDHYWRPRTGLDLAALLHGSPAAHRLGRGRFRARRAAGRARHALRRLRA